MPGLNTEGKTMVYAHCILFFQRNPNDVASHGEWVCVCFTHCAYDMHVCALLIVLTICMCALNSLYLRSACVCLTHCAYDMRVCALLTICCVCLSQCTYDTLCGDVCCFSPTPALWPWILLRGSSFICLNIFYLYFCMRLMNFHWLIDVCVHISASFIADFADLDAFRACTSFLVPSGQMIWLPHCRHLLFMGSPRLPLLDDFRNMKVYLSDIPLYDVTREVAVFNQKRIADIIVAWVNTELASYFCFCLAFFFSAWTFRRSSALSLCFFYCWLQLDTRHMGHWHSTRASVHISVGRVAVFDSLKKYFWM